MKPSDALYRAAAPAEENVNQRHDLLELLRIENENLREAQTLSEQTREEYAELYEFAPLPLLVLASNGAIERVNWAAAALVGEEPRRLSGRMLRSLVHPIDRSRLAEHLSRCRATRSAETCELRLISSVGLDVLVELRTRPATGGRASYQIAVVDLRERERIAEEKRQLLASERQARQAAAARDQFIAMLSHELRTPLTPVLAMASALRNRSDLSPELRRVFEMMRRNISAEARLIDDLLDVTGIARGKVHIEPQPVDLHEVIAGAIELARSEAPIKRLSIESELDAEHHVVMGDPARLSQVFVNLLRNAIKFTPEDGRVSVRSWNNAGKIAIEVDDSGIGFDQQMGPRLFEPFEQLGNERQTRGGLGLGLAISKGLVELHGGVISASSRGPNLGARFVVELETSVGAAALALARQSEAPPPASSARRLVILLIEDHVDTMEIMVHLLQAHGYDVVTARSVSTALAVDLSGVDMIVSDLGLPDGSGIDLIRQLQSERHRPAIALSGYGSQADVQECANAGFDTHLTKPVDIDRLVRVVRTLAVKAAKRASEPPPTPRSAR